MFGSYEGPSSADTADSGHRLWRRPPAPGEAELLAGVPDQEQQPAPRPMECLARPEFAADDGLTRLGRGGLLAYIHRPEAEHSLARNPDGFCCRRRAAVLGLGTTHPPHLPAVTDFGPILPRTMATSSAVAVRYSTVWRRNPTVRNATEGLQPGFNIAASCWRAPGRGHWPDPTTRIGTAWSSAIHLMGKPV